ncbi:hypothetical protein ACE4Z6_27195, partial [Salmonella enterica]|uniref:hypothetical protein n=1 Tax=Salmonella enterica TaxID=28901 RepID=UPI003D29B7B5
MSKWQNKCTFSFNNDVKLSAYRLIFTMKLFFSNLYQNYRKKLLLPGFCLCYFFAWSQPNTTINLDDYKSKRYE